MDKKLIKKMIRDCFQQYNVEGDSFPVKEEELADMLKKITKLKMKEPSASLYEIINDIVYEYITCEFIPNEKD